MTLDTPAGPIILADSIRDLSAARYLLFQQAWAREIGVGSDLYAVDGHLARLGALVAAKDDGALPAYNNLVLAFTNLTADVPVSYRAAVLAPLVVSIAGAARPDASATGLAATAGALADALTQQQLVQAVDAVKKKFRPTYA